MFNSPFIKSSVIALLLTTVLCIDSADAFAAEPAKASDWIGRVVVTDDGELLGRVEDFALDIENKRIEFVVVSIGSFLIDNNLVAVHPDALGVAEDERYLVVYSDSLASANRFGNESWPQQADVQPSADRQPVAVADDIEDQDASNRSNDDRVATISDGRRTATMKAGERKALIETTGGDLPTPAVVDVQPKLFRDRASGEPLLADSEFKRLDDNDDGYLSRREIGARLQRDVRYNDYDLDGNDGIDPFEFQLLKNRG